MDVDKQWETDEEKRADNNRELKVPYRDSGVEKIFKKKQKKN